LPWVELGRYFAHVGGKGRGDRKEVGKGTRRKKEFVTAIKKQRMRERERRKAVTNEGKGVEDVWAHSPNP